MLLAGLIAGALYNPWTGPQTRDWLTDKVAGDDDLQPLDGFDIPSEGMGNGARRSANGSGRAVAEAADIEGPERYRSCPPVGLFGARPDRVDSSDPGTSPLVLEMSSASSRTAAAGRSDARSGRRRPVDGE